jgi:hypothetical protein
VTTTTAGRLSTTQYIGLSQILNGMGTPLTSLDALISDVAAYGNPYTINGNGEMQPPVHVHDTADITSGTIATARLASGTASASTYLRGDQTWAAISTYTLPSATTSTLGGVIVGTGLGVSSGTASVTYGTTAGTACQGNDSRLSDSRTPTSHVHGNITNAGAIGSTSGLPIITTTSGVLTVGAFGSTAGTFAQGNDSRLSDARTPTSHVHAAGDITTGTLAAARLPLSTTAQALTGTDTATALTPAAMHLSRRGSGRAKFFELFTDFAVNGSGFSAGTDGVLFQPDFTGTGSAGSTNGGAGATLASFSGRVGAGLFACITGTTATGRSGFDSRETSTIFRFDTGTTTYETLVYLPNLADATDGYVFRVGFCQGNALSNDVMCFEYNRSNSANWVGVTGWNGGYNRVTSSVAVAATKWILLRLVFTSSSCEFFVNDASIGTSSSSIKADGSMRIGCHLLKTAGTTSRSALVDYVYVRHDFNSDRTYT